MGRWTELILAVLLLALAAWLYGSGHALGTDSSSLSVVEPPGAAGAPVPSLLGSALGSSAQEYPANEGDRHIMTWTESEFIYNTWLKPHNSLMPAEAVVALRNWYGIPVPVTLAVTACETSLGDPVLGGRLVSVFNFGCVRGNGPNNTPWGRLAVGSITVGGKRWYRWPDAWTGMAALGRLLKVGPGFKPGYYLRCIEAEDWRALTEMYYLGKPGTTTPEYEEYHRRWLGFYNLFNSKLIAAHFLGDGEGD